MDLGKLSLTELKRLQARIETEIARRADSAKKDLLKKVQKLASDAGVPLSDLLGKKSGRTGRKPGAPKGRKVPPKYRNPADTSQTWTGRGRQPAWVAAYLKSGKKIDNLLIK
ncbi:H-NS histone family protein [Viridibacterium curvum]|uniref:H-NS histone family protein n=1 Tax=Viridibacterium curvum TaxID=1101404 RepID=A0ABP9R398_9RHOO